MKTTNGAWTNGLIGVAAFFATSIPLTAQAGLEVQYEPDGAECHRMLAGQHIDVGEVCVEVDKEKKELLVTYNTENGWELTEAHLWTGLDLNGMPKSRNGNPMIGNFPYNSGNISGADAHTFAVPLEKAFGTAELCDVPGFLAAHAALRKENGSGGYQTETGWVDGERLTQRGSWAMYSSITFTCPPEPVIVSVGERECETAYAFGDTNFKELLESPRWGWQITLKEDQRTEPIYAGAAQNDVNKGTKVGELNIVRNGDWLTVSYDIDPALLDDTHLYVGELPLSDTAPGQYSDETGLKKYTRFVGNASTLYVVAHAVVCN
jgi:hypothetical protein